MVSEPSIGQCANEDAGLQGGWIVRSHIGWRGERNISYKGVETSLEQTRFKTLRGSLEGKVQTIGEQNIPYKGVETSF